LLRLPEACGALHSISIGRSGARR